MTRYLLVPENQDIHDAREVKIPKNLIVPGISERLDLKIKTLSRNSHEVATEPTQKINPNNALKPMKDKKLRGDLVHYTLNTSLAKRLLRFLRYHQFNVDNDGYLILRGVKYPIILEDHFRDLVDGGFRRPKGYEILYKLLNRVGLKYVCDSRKKHFLN